MRSLNLFQLSKVAIFLGPECFNAASEKLEAEIKLASFPKETKHIKYEKSSNIAKRKK